MELATENLKLNVGVSRYMHAIGDQSDELVCLDSIKCFTRSARSVSAVLGSTQLPVFAGHLHPALYHQ